MDTLTRPGDGEARAAEDEWRGGAAYVDGKFMPLSRASIPLNDWGYRRSDVTYDVVSVHGGRFFRLDDHLQRFRNSMKSLRLNPKESDEDIREVLHRIVGRTGLREAYVAFDCLRGRVTPGARYHPVNARNYIVAHAVPYITLLGEDVVERGAHAIISSTPRIPQACVDATAKNFHWADMNRSLFEADDKGADVPFLLDLDGNLTEGPGFNIFVVRDGVVATPDYNVLEGISRKSVLDICGELGLACEVRKIPVQEVRDADEIFISSTAGGAFGVSRLDGMIMNNDRPGPVSRKVRETYWKKRAEGWHGEPVKYYADAS